MVNSGWACGEETKGPLTFFLKKKQLVYKKLVGFPIKSYRCILGEINLNGVQSGCVKLSSPAVTIIIKLNLVNFA